MSDGNKSLTAIVKKEFTDYFTSPIAFIFLFIFLAVNGFLFFWVERFFERNIADVRPLFEWMPLMLIFLVSALTMKMWSEERRMGTIEFLLTLPATSAKIAVGKFLACLLLVGVALLLTFGIPITASFMGALDWGPVIGAYLASFLLAGAYISIGLFMSSKSDNQIVSLLLTIIVCFVFYLIGSPVFLGLFGVSAGEIFQLLGTGSRFESVSRGVIDIRDLYYYVSITGIFLALNILSLEKIKWCESSNKPQHHLWRRLVALAIVNLIACMIWLQKVPFLRADLTRGSQYTVSASTRHIVSQLQEPLLIRGYFSSKTHKLLSPLIPQLKDLVTEYNVVSNGKVRVEFVDPRENPELEQEANQKYSIKPVPLQVSDKYQTSLVNSYFNILILYGDKYEVLDFRDLIEIKAGGEGQMDVRLRNPEYDITRSIKRAVQGFQTTDDLFGSLTEPLSFEAYLSADAKLPQQLVGFAAQVRSGLKMLSEQSGGKLEYNIIDPEADGGAAAEQIDQEYGFKPMALSLFDSNRFYFYMLIRSQDKMVQIPVPEALSEEAFISGVNSALKRFSPGFLKTVGLVTPLMPNMDNPYMAQAMRGQVKHFRALEEKLKESHESKTVSLKEGSVPDDADLLVMLAPKEVDDKQLFAIDQFLMKGGTVVLATSPVSIKRGRDSVKAEEHKSGLEDWLKNYGIEFEDKIVMDSQNEMYPVPVKRNLGMFSVEEIKMINYPPFVDIRGEGLNSENMITSGIPQVTLNWPSPLKIDEKKQEGRTVIDLLSSSEQSWASISKNVLPEFIPDAPRGRHLLAAVVEGKFESFFKGKESPLLKKEKKEGPEEAPGADKFVASGVIEKSTDSARLIVFASNEFLADQTLQISSVSGTGQYMNSLQIIENAVDWSLEDRDLLGIRGRAHFTRTLRPMEDSVKRRYEYLNYILMLLGLGLVYVLHRSYKASVRAEYKNLLGV